MGERTVNNSQAAEEEVNKNFSDSTGVPEGNKFSKIEYGGYLLSRKIRRFFWGDRPEKKNLNKFSDIAETLISTVPDDPNSDLLNASEKLLEQQRVLEDTRARRRLERWATRTISIYLLSVFFLLIANGIVLVYHPIETIEFMGGSQTVVKRGFITDSIMTVILSTTTINIIGLGVIVLKGHFDKSNQKDKKQI